MDKDRAKIKAQKIVDSGTQPQRINLAIAEMDVRENNWYGIRQYPLLMPEEYARLLDNIAADCKSREQLAAKKLHFSKVTRATREVANKMVNAYRRNDTLEFYVAQLASAEELETAVNIVLQYIPTLEQRKAVAIGLAQQIDHRGCCNSVSPDGMLIISKQDVLADYDLEHAIEEWRGGLMYTMSTAKAYIEAIYEYMDMMKLDMPVTKQYLSNEEDEMRKMCLCKKYQDRQQMRLDEETSKELQESGKPLLYDRYRLMPKYEDIQALPLAKSIIKRAILM